MSVERIILFLSVMKVLESISDALVALCITTTVHLIYPHRPHLPPLSPAAVPRQGLAPSLLADQTSKPLKGKFNLMSVKQKKRARPRN